jgi:hypothetical protein
MDPSYGRGARASRREQVSHENGQDSDSRPAGASSSHVGDFQAWPHRLLPRPHLLLEHSGPAAATLEGRVRQLEEQLRTVERERDVLKRALAIFSQKI